MRRGAGGSEEGIGVGRCTQENKGFCAALYDTLVIFLFTSCSGVSLLTRSTHPPHLDFAPFAPGLYVVRCFEFKEMLATSAEALAKRLLDQIRGSMRASSVKINEEYQVRGQGEGGSWGTR